MTDKLSSTVMDADKPLKVVDRVAQGVPMKAHNQQSDSRLIELPAGTWLTLSHSHTLIGSALHNASSEIESLQSKRGYFLAVTDLLMLRCTIAELLHRIFTLTLTGHTLRLEATYSSTTGRVFNKRAKWPEGTNKRPKRAWVKKWQKDQLNRLLALPLTCRAIHSQTLSILYLGAHYSFDLDSLWRAEQFPLKLGDGALLRDVRSYLLAMRSLTICYGPMRDYKLQPKAFFLNLLAEHAVNLEDLTVEAMVCDWYPE